LTFNLSYFFKLYLILIAQHKLIILF